MAVPERGGLVTAPGFPRAQFLVLALACVACLAPFSAKAFHIDDPLFVWTARHIHDHPGDFYGFSVNWYFEEKPMSEVTKNPPLACYYLALAGSIFGWSEVSLHLACLLPAVLMIWGTYRLAREFCTRPLLAAFIALLTPAFLVSSSTVMCDTLLGCFWIWAMVFWELGLRRRRLSLLCLSGFLIALAALTKYFGVSLVPLFVVYSCARLHRLGRWLLALVIPLAILLGYQWVTHLLYGQGLLEEAASYATRVQAQSATRIPIYAKLLIGLAFTGGSVASAIFYLPLLWPRRIFLPATGAVAGLIWLLYFMGALGPFRLVVDGAPRWEVIVPAALFAAGGISVLALAVADLRDKRDEQSLLLLLWVAGTFVFTAFVNWSINGRSLLPLVPAVGILVMRRIDLRRGPVTGSLEWSKWLPLLPAGVLAVLVTVADYDLARSAKIAASELHALPGRSGNLWFQGHWGFQYYMQEAGARCLDIGNMHLAAGDWIIQPDDNYGKFALPDGTVRKRATLSAPAFPWLATMHSLVGAGFYSNRKGPLPFAVGPVSDSEYQVLEVIRPVEGRLLLLGE